MIEKIYENKFGVIHYVGLKKDLETIKTNEDYLFSKANGSKFYNIENLSDSLVWNEEDKQWIEYDARGINTDDYVLKEALDNYVLKEEGKGLSTEDFTTFYKGKLDNLETIGYKIVDVLPESGERYYIYFVPDNVTEEGNNFYVEFMYLETTGWEMIGTTKVDLSDYFTKGEINSMLNGYVQLTALNTELAKYVSQTNLTEVLNNSYYQKEETYTKTEVDEKFQTKIQILTQEEYDTLVTAGTVDTNTTYLIKSDF